MFLSMNSEYVTNHFSFFALVARSHTGKFVTNKFLVLQDSPASQAFVSPSFSFINIHILICEKNILLHVLYK